MSLLRDGELEQKKEDLDLCAFWLDLKQAQQTDNREFIYIRVKKVIGAMIVLKKKVYSPGSGVIIESIFLSLLRFSLLRPPLSPALYAWVTTITSWSRHRMRQWFKMIHLENAESWHAETHTPTASHPHTLQRSHTKTVNVKKRYWVYTFFPKSHRSKTACWVRFRMECVLSG